MDASAVKLLADLVEIDTHEAAGYHEDKNGKLPQMLWKTIGGTRSHHLSTVQRLPSPYSNRVFSTWRCWQKEVKEGNVQYVFGFVPQSMYNGTVESIDTQERYVKGDFTGICVIEEVAPQVCSVLWVESANLKTNLPQAIKILFAKSEMRWANELQEKYRRHGKVVDKEVGDALVEKMRDGVELSGDLTVVFKELDDLFGGVDGWKDLESPYAGVDMWIKFQQQAKGERTIAFGKFKDMADCSAENACAWMFEYCSNERMAIDRSEGNLARLEGREGRHGINEKVRMDES